ncbi:MAG: Fic family protein [Clostridia bacterium]|nr:Fic family protein [Clostridia bacterium]
MNYTTVDEIAKKWGVSERAVRNYCAEGRVGGAILEGKTWKIPDNAEKPVRKKRNDAVNTLLDVLKEEKKAKLRGGIYHRVQIDLTYNSNHIEGSRLTHDQTRYIYETNTIGIVDEAVRVDDIIETTNHFRCIDFIIDKANASLSETIIKQLHYLLKSGTSDSRKDWFAVGEYKRLPNEVGGMDTTMPEEVAEEIKSLLTWYNSLENVTLEDVIEFHVRFEKIHPFQDGNGRVGRLIMFKECLKNDIVPFIIDENHKLFYYRGLKEWTRERGYLIDTCISAQDNFKLRLDYYRIKHDE